MDGTTPMKPQTSRGGAPAEIDALGAILADHARKQHIRRLPQKEQKEARRQAKRSRITLDLHPTVIAVLKKKAEELHCSPANLANVLLAAELAACLTDWLEEFLVPCPSYRWDWMMDLNGSDLLTSLQNILEESK